MVSRTGGDGLSFDRQGGGGWRWVVRGRVFPLFRRGNLEIAIVIVVVEEAGRKMFRGGLGFTDVFPAGIVFISAAGIVFVFASFVGFISTFAIVFIFAAILFLVFAAVLDTAGQILFGRFASDKFEFAFFHYIRHSARSPPRQTTPLLTTRPSDAAVALFLTTPLLRPQKRASTLKAPLPHSSELK